ncbi:YhdP family protein [Teichococcus coralli]|uniref:YhdP family protein n=1 Tax=Teichococcus coralli TaxID=2545983 RepID=UPI0034624CDE
MSRQALRLARLLGRMVLALGLLAGLGAAALAWRLAQGPLHLPAVADLLMRSGAVESLAPGLRVGDVALAWEGFHEGHGSPLELRIGGLELRDLAGTVRQRLPDAVVTLSPGWLLRGEVAPITVAVQRPTIVLERGADGALSLAMGRPSPAPSQPESDEEGGLVLRRLLGREARDTPWGVLRRIDIADGQLTILDHQLGLTWRLEDVSLTLRRSAGGDRVDGEGKASLRLPGAGPVVPVRLAASILGEGPVLEGTLSLPGLEPARLAALLPALAPLALFDGSIALDVSGRFDAGAPQATPRLGLALHGGPGSFRAAGHRIAFAALDLSARGTPAALELSRLRVALAPATAGAAALPAPVLTASGQAALRDDRWRASLELGLDQVQAGELGTYWPPDIVRGARKWIVENVTAGTLHEGRFALRAESAADLSGLQVTDLSGTLQLENGVVHWLRPIAPLEAVQATAQFGLKEITIQVAAARQAGTALNSPGATIRFSALDTHDEQADIDARLRGPVAQAVALIKHPRLKLFERRPLDLKNPSGQLDGRLHLAFPLLEDIPSEVLRVNLQAQLSQFHLSDVVVGKPLDHGTASLTVDNSRLRANGEALLDGIPTQLAVEMDLRPGPASQVVERIRADARPDASRIAEFGLDLEGFVEGPVGVQAVMEKRRDGETRVRLAADLRDSRMALSALAWRKAPRQAASAQAELRIAEDSLRAVESFQVEAPDLRARGKVAFGPQSRLERVELNEARIFAGRFAAEMRPPAQPGAPWRFRLSGPALDLGPLLAEPDDKGGAASGDSAPVMLDGRFDHVLLGEGRSLGTVQGRAAADGRGVLREARFSGLTAPGSGFDLTIVPRGQGRDLQLNAEDAGALLQAFDVLRQVQGGRLSVNGHWASNAPGAPLSGTAEMSDFTIQEAAGVGKLLQALTVYGVVDAVRGPGLSFSRLVAPFTLTPEALALREARAFSASLGVTAKGTILRRSRVIDLEGTIVPAYALNTLLGRIPLLGKLFSPEQGGGLFAATWRMRGPVQDPAVTVNPLAALTPGFLRGLFGGGTAPAP